MEVALHERAALGEHLEDVPIGRFHGVEDAVDERAGDLLMEQVAHGVDEDHAGPLPGKRLRQPFGAQGEVEAVLEGMARHAAEALGQALGVAVVAAACDLGATGDGVPGRVGPFDLRHDAAECVLSSAFGKGLKELQKAEDHQRHERAAKKEETSY